MLQACPSFHSTGHGDVLDASMQARIRESCRRDALSELPLLSEVEGGLEAMGAALMSVTRVGQYRSDALQNNCLQDRMADHLLRAPLRTRLR